MNGFLTVKEVADKWDMTVRNVQNLCAAGKIEGVAKFGNAWAIPEDAEKPQDMRVISGAYKNWRKKSQQYHETIASDTKMILFFLKYQKTPSVQVNIKNENTDFTGISHQKQI